jgi:dihydroorotase
MTILLKNALVIDPSTPPNDGVVDIFIKNGKIKTIGKNLLTDEKSVVLDVVGAMVSPGWFDLGAVVGEPGFEHREDITSLCQGAAAGGYTGVAVQPNTQPVMDNKGTIAYLKNKSFGNIVTLYPIGALSKECKGQEISEMYDMREAGAIAFSDGIRPMQDNGLMLRALEYVKGFEGLVINHPHDKSLSSGGQMHEGLMSTTLGMRGIPSLSEEMLLQRDIYLLEYSESRLHVSNLSTAGSVALVRAAKAKGLEISCSVAAMNLLFTDEALFDFDTNLKVAPPLRPQSDVEALIEGLKDGTIDCITSNHVAHDDEAKNLEYPYASFGALGLETAFAAVHTALSDTLSLPLLIEKFAIAPRRLLGLDIPSVKEGEPANLTIFNPTQTWVYEAKNCLSKSKNSPFFGKTFTGKVVGVVNNNQLNR